MNISSIKEHECSGCTACNSICPSNAIVMRPNEKGFYHPYISEDKCTNCGLCYNLCKEKEAYGQKALLAYAVKNKSEQVLKKSSSGGASRALMETIINNGGVVYGATYKEDFSVMMSRASNILECDKFYGSKYVAANINDSYKSVLKDLKNGLVVLFISTSCYIAGLYVFLKYKKCDTKNLFTADLICHGVSSPKLFKDYIDFVNPEKNLQLINFRSKLKPWRYGNYNCVLVRKNGKIELNTPKTKTFINIYNTNCAIRQHCFTCPYAEGKRPADFTLSDFWHIEDVCSNFYSKLGVSGVQINTTKGKMLWESVTSVDKIVVDPQSILSNNLHQHTDKPENYDMFWMEYFNKGFMSIAKKFGGYNFKDIVIHYINRMKAALKND